MTYLNFKGSTMLCIIYNFIALMWDCIIAHCMAFGAVLFGIIGPILLYLQILYVYTIILALYLLTFTILLEFTIYTRNYTWIYT